MSAHTPGPWRSALMSDKTWHVGVYGPDGSNLAIIKVASALCGPRCDADARLMAAAPELLRACRQAIVELKGREHDGFLRDVIAQATGGES